MKQRKKFAAALLAALLAVCLTACGGANSVEKQLQGTWVLEGDVGATYIFNDDRFSCESFVAGISLGVKEGSYEIGEDTIILNYDNGVAADIAYSMEKGTLSLYFSGDQPLVKQ